jgi:hypothetical protein
MKLNPKFIQAFADAAIPLLGYFLWEWYLWTGMGVCETHYCQVWTQDQDGNVAGTTFGERSL